MAVFKIFSFTFLFVIMMPSICQDARIVDQRNVERKNQVLGSRHGRVAATAVDSPAEVVSLSQWAGCAQ